MSNSEKFRFQADYKVFLTAEQLIQLIKERVQEQYSDFEATEIVAKVHEHSLPLIDFISLRNIEVRLKRK